MRLTKVDPDGRESPLYSKNTNYTMVPGSALRWQQACGGGYGDPLQRDPAAVLRDWLDELITAADAREQYGVVVDESTHTVQSAATEALRAQRSAREET